MVINCNNYLIKKCVSGTGYKTPQSKYSSKVTIYILKKQHKRLISRKEKKKEKGKMFIQIKNI